MKISRLLLTVVGIALASTTPAKAQSPCGSTTYSVQINCSSQVCNSSVTVYQPILNPVIQYYENDQYCCGARFPSYYSTGQFCISAALRRPEVMENLRLALSSRELLVANCDGSYTRFGRATQSTSTKPLLSRHRLPLS